MALNGLLLLTSSTVSIASRSRLNLLGAKKFLEVLDKRSTIAHVLPPGVLYVVQWCPVDLQETRGPSASSMTSLIYSQGNAQCPSVDIRLLLNGGVAGNKSATGRLLGRPQVPIDMVMVDGCPTRISLDAVKSFVNEWFSVSRKDYPVQYLAKGEDIVFPEEVVQDGGDSVDSSGEEFRQYDVVALGGTFDRMHNAHKVLLTEAVLRCTKEIIVGVTSDQMIKSMSTRIMSRTHSLRHILIVN